MISEDHLFEYEVRPDGAVITRFLGLPASADSLSVLVPDTLGGAPVTAIAPRAFSDNGTTLMEIHLPDALRSIGEEAFAYCYLLERLDLGHGVETIGGGFLSFCGSMEELTLPASVRQIDRPYLLNALRVKTEHAPGDLNVTHSSAALEDQQKRSNQRRSEPPHVSRESPERSGRGRFVSDGFALYERLTECGGPAGSAAPLRLISVSSASERSSYAVLPGTVEIGVQAFEGQSHLCDLILPDTLEAIGDHAFRDCPALSCFDLPASVRRIGEAALENSGWNDQVDSLIPIRTHGGACSIESSSLLLREGSGCCLVRYFGHDSQYTIPAQVTVIRTGAFHRTDLRAIRFPASVRQVEPSAFTGNSKLERFDFDLGRPAGTTAPASAGQNGSETAAPCLHGAANGAAPRSATVLFPDVVFRKDDIEALFLPQAEVLVCLGQKLAFEPDPDTLFQFRAYDCLFETYAGAMEQAFIAISRLAWPIDLSSARRDFYRSWLAANLPDLLAEMTRKDDPGMLRQVLSLHILNQTQVLDAIAFCEEHRRPVCLQLLLSFHHQEFGEEDFDYSL